MPFPTATVTAFISALVLGLVLSPIFGRIATNLGVSASPRPDRWGARPTPLLGGAALMLGTFVPTLLLAPPSQGMVATVAAASAAFGVGLLDDVRGLRPTSKVVGQVVAASILAIGGVQVRFVEFAPLSFILTVLWVVVMMNAVNLVDNMDGLAAGVSAIAAAVLILMSPGDPLWIAVLAASLAGACLGFLRHNFAPARIYMGDAGSQLLGLLLAALALVLTNVAASNVGLAVLGPLLVLGLPIYDTMLVALVRRLQGRPLSKGGRDHTSHRLAELGLSERATVLVLFGVAGILATLGLLANALDLAFVPLAALAIVGLTLFGIFLEQATTGATQRRSEELPGVRVFAASAALTRFGGEIALDVILAATALFSAYLLRFESLHPSDLTRLFVAAAPIVVPTQLLAFVALGVYRPLWKFLGVIDLVIIARAVVAGTVVAGILLLYVLRLPDQSKGVLLIDAVLLTLLVAGSRVFFAALHQSLTLRPRRDGRRVLIVGATESGEMALRALLRSPKVHYHPAGFLDDDPGKLRRRIAGVPVVGRTTDLGRLARHHTADLVVVALDGDGAARERIIAQCAVLGIEVREFARFP